MNTMQNPLENEPSLPTWQELLAKEPQLQTLKVMANSISNTDGECPLRAWHEEVLPALRRILGSDRNRYDPVLSNDRAYDVANFFLRSLIPSCLSCPQCREEAD